MGRARARSGAQDELELPPHTSTVKLGDAYANKVFLNQELRNMEKTVLRSTSGNRNRSM